MNSHTLLQAVIAIASLPLAQSASLQVRPTAGTQDDSINLAAAPTSPEERITTALYNQQDGSQYITHGNNMQSQGNKQFTQGIQTLDGVASTSSQLQTNHQGDTVGVTSDKPSTHADVGTKSREGFTQAPNATVTAQQQYPATKGSELEHDTTQTVLSTATVLQGPHTRPANVMDTASKQPTTTTEPEPEQSSIQMDTYTDLHLPHTQAANAMGTEAQPLTRSGTEHQQTLAQASVSIVNDPQKSYSKAAQTNDSQTTTSQQPPLETATKSQISPPHVSVADNWTKSQPHERFIGVDVNANNHVNPALTQPFTTMSQNTTEMHLKQTVMIGYRGVSNSIKEEAHSAEENTPTKSPMRPITAPILDQEQRTEALISQVETVTLFDKNTPKETQPLNHTLQSNRSQVAPLHATQPQTMTTYKKLETSPSSSTHSGGSHLASTIASIGRASAAHQPASIVQGKSLPPVHALPSLNIQPQIPPTNIPAVQHSSERSTPQHTIPVSASQPNTLMRLPGKLTSTQSNSPTKKPMLASTLTSASTNNPEHKGGLVIDKEPFEQHTAVISTISYSDSGSNVVSTAKPSFHTNVQPIVSAIGVDARHNYKLNYFGKSSTVVQPPPCDWQPGNNRRQVFAPLSRIYQFITGILNAYLPSPLTGLSSSYPATFLARPCKVAQSQEDKTERPDPEENGREPNLKELPMTTPSTSQELQLQQMIQVRVTDQPQPSQAMQQQLYQQQHSESGIHSDRHNTHQKQLEHPNIRRIDLQHSVFDRPGRMTFNKQIRFSDIPRWNLSPRMSRLGPRFQAKRVNYFDRTPQMSDRVGKMINWRLGGHQPHGDFARRHGYVQPPDQRANLHSDHLQNAEALAQDLIDDIIAGEVLA